MLPRVLLLLLLLLQQQQQLYRLQNVQVPAAHVAAVVRACACRSLSHQSAHGQPPLHRRRLLRMLFLACIAAVSVRLAAAEAPVVILAAVEAPVVRPAAAEAPVARPAAAEAPVARLAAAEVLAVVGSRFLLAKGAVLVVVAVLGTFRRRRSLQLSLSPTLQLKY